MSFKDLRDKALKKISQTDFKGNFDKAMAKTEILMDKGMEKADEAVVKAIEKAKTPKTNDQLISEIAIGIGLTAITGGLALPALAGVVIKAGALQAFAKSDAAKKAAAVKAAEEQAAIDAAKSHPHKKKPKTEEGPKAA